MLLSLGLLAASAPAAGGSYELIETYTVGSTPQASITFTVSSYNTTYQHLQIRGVGKTNATGDINGDTLRVRLNGVTTSSYVAHGLYGVSGSGTPASYASTSQTSMRAARISSNYSGTNSATFGATVIDILDPYETKNKTIRALGGESNSMIRLMSGAWLNTAAVSSVTIDNRGGQSFVQFSRFSIYGIRGS